ncbi:MAG TPA: hypothetical protein VMQ44_01940 [Candidatus Saccharimonadales bacterium]|nr:hypothetical protein [Candidatus Saccharimonadales bacterium]
MSKQWVKNIQVLNALGNFLILIGIIFLAVTLYGRFYKTPVSTATQSQLTNTRDPGFSTLKERQLAIDDAIKNGQKTYSFTTSFIPGIGYISDPDAYKTQWLNSLPTN